MREHTDHVWHVFLPEIKPGGQFYGYRVQGPYEPEKGARFNASKLLIDPYAKAIAGPVSWSDEVFGYVMGDPKADLGRDFRDNAWACRSRSSSTRHSTEVMTSRQRRL